MERLIDLDMKTLDERWSAQMRKKYWPLLQSPATNKPVILELYSPCSDS